VEYKAVPIDLISEPNTWATIPNNRWVLTNPNAQTIAFVLHIVDALSERRYVPPTGSTMQVIFQRRDKVATDTIKRNVLTSEEQTITKTAVVSVYDSSMFKVALSKADVDTILAGTVKFLLTEPSKDVIWVQNWALEKKLTSPGF